MAGLVPGLTVRALGALAGFTGFGVGYGMAKIMTGQDSDPDSMANSSWFKMGAEAFLYSNGIFPTVLCEHDSQGYRVGPLPDDFDAQQELFQSTPIIVSNHVSYVDAIILPTICGMPKFMSMAEVKNWHLFGPLGQDLNYIWVDRKDPEARKKALEAIETHVKEWRPGSRPLLIFPEGTTSNGQGLHAFKKGAFAAGAPVRPVVVKYTGSWDPANVNFREPETPEEVSEMPTTLDPANPGSQYVQYGDGDWAMQFAGHLLHTCTVLVCRVYYPSEEEKADPLLYAANVRAFMLKRLQELHVTCSGSRGNSNLDERLLALRRRMRMQTLLKKGDPVLTGTEQLEKPIVSSRTEPAMLISNKTLDASLWRSPSASRVARRSVQPRRRSSSCMPFTQSEEGVMVPAASTAGDVSPARVKLRERAEKRRSRREALPEAGFLQSAVPSHMGKDPAQLSTTPKYDVPDK